MDPKRVIRKLRAILSADVQGYSRLMGDDEVATVKTITEYREIFSSIVTQHNGRVVDSPGDNILSEFGSVVDAVQCAVEIQRVLKAKNEDLPENRRMIFRIGVNLGDVIHEGDRIYGDGVNIAARIESIAPVGGICISGSAYEQIENKLAFSYEDLGEHSVKNIARPIRVYRIPVGVEREAVDENPKEESAKTVTTEKPSIAVLPFDNLNKDSEHEYLSDSLAESIITTLAKIPGLLVIARNSTSVYKGKPVKVQQVSEELGARYVLEGSVQTSGEQVRITAQLIDAATGYHLWAERYRRNIGDVLSLQDEITMKIVVAFQVKLTSGDKARLWGQETRSLEAYEKIMEAYGHLFSFTKEGNNRAKQLAREALEIDGKHRCAHRMLGSTEVFDVILGIANNPEESMERAYGFYIDALALDESDGHTHALIGIVLTTMGKYDEGIAEALRAIELSPSDSDAHYSLAYGENASGNHTAALSSIKKAISFDPMTSAFYLSLLGEVYFFLEEYEKAISALTNALLKTPSLSPCYILLAACYGCVGKKDKAQEVAKQILSTNPGFTLELLKPNLIYKNRSDVEFLLDGLRTAGLN